MLKSSEVQARCLNVHSSVDEGWHTGDKLGGKTTKRTLSTGEIRTGQNIDQRPSEPKTLRPSGNVTAKRVRVSHKLSRQ